MKYNYNFTVLGWLLLMGLACSSCHYECTNTYNFISLDEKLIHL